MRIFVFIFLLAVSALSGNAQPDGKLVILHTNDLHSKLRGFAPETAYTPLVTGDDATMGGFSRLATAIAREKTETGENLLVLDAGDFLMGTLFHHFEPLDGFQLRLMKKMGYDLVSLGNHEFDYGPEVLSKIIGSGASTGVIPQLILSNAVLDKKDRGDDQIGSLFANGTIRRSFIIEKKDLGLKIGFFSLMGKDADDVAPAAVPLTFSGQIRTARKLVKQLRNEGCNMIICLSHSGVSIDKRGRLRGEDYKLASKVKGIDLIISGHTHTKLVEPLIVNGIPIVQTGSYGMNLGRITFDIIGGKPVFSEAILEPIDDEIQGDPDVESLIEERISLINEKLLTQLGLNYQMSVADASFRLVCDEYGDLYSSNLGPLVADAIHSYINRHNAPGSDISIVAAGVIRDAIVPGIQSVPDIFRVMSLGSGNDDTPGYPLSRVYVTGRELKNIIEILLVAREKSSSQFIYYSGVKVRYDSSKGMLRKISSIEIVKGDGSVFDVDITRKSNHLYSISANSYILEFIGIIKKMSFGLIRVEPKNGAGVKIADFNNAVIPFTDKDGALVEGKEWLALLEFLSEMPDISGDGIPDIAQKYAKPEPNIIDIKK